MENIEGEVAVGVVENNEEFLIMRRSEENSSSGKWTFPGGKIEEDESPKEAVVREMREETGLEVEVKNSGDTYLDEEELGTWKISPFLLKSESRNVEMNHEHDKLRWIKIKELEDLDALGRMKAPGKLGLE